MTGLVRSTFSPSRWHRPVAGIATTWLRPYRVPTRALVDSGVALNVDNRTKRPSNDVFASAKPALVRSEMRTFSSKPGPRGGRREKRRELRRLSRDGFQSRRSSGPREKQVCLTYAFLPLRAALRRGVATQTGSGSDRHPVAIEMRGRRLAPTPFTRPQRPEVRS